METYNIDTHKRGDTFNGLVFAITVNGSPANLTGALIKMDLRYNGVLWRRFTTATPGTDEGTITITDAAAGKFRLDEQIIDIPGVLYDYDAQITFSDDRVKTYFGGNWQIDEDVTNDR